MSIAEAIAALDRFIEHDVRADLAITWRLLKWTAIVGMVAGATYLVGRVAEWW